MTQLKRAVAVAAVLLSVSAATAVPVFAGVAARGSKAQVVASGTWKATPSATTFTFAASNAPPPQYFTVSNDGSLNLVGATYALTVTARSTGTVSVQSCTLPWDENLNLCPGVVTSIVTSRNSPQSVTTLGLFPASPGSSIRLQISDTRAGPGGVTVTVAVKVTRSQARAATTMNS